MLSREQERRRRSNPLFTSALENWKERSASDTQASIKQGLMAGSKTTRAMQEARQGVRKATEVSSTSNRASDANQEMADFYGSWGTIIDETFGNYDDLDKDLGEDSSAKKPPRITKDEVDAGMFIPDFDIETDLDMAATALGQIESSGDYSAIGDKITNKDSMYYGDRAYGMHQVMGKNIAPWTKKYLGKEMTKEQFLADSEAQDNLVRAFLTTEYEKHGTIEDAVSVWFTGRPLKKATEEGAADQNITVNEYVSRFRNEFLNLIQG